MKIISILGSTGSIGKSSLSVISLHPNRFKVFALGGFNNVDLLLEQTIKFKPNYIVTKDLLSKKLLIDKELFPILPVEPSIEIIFILNN